MLDQWTTIWIRLPLDKGAKLLKNRGIKPDQITLIGFLTGMAAVPLLWQQHYIASLCIILINRLMDGLDGALARLYGPTDAGGFLDITLDMIFYSAIIFGFFLANTHKNAIAANLLLFSFIGTGASFLAYAVIAEKHSLTRDHLYKKSLYYPRGLIEGTETIMLLVLLCFIPENFPIIASSFAILCIITTIIRVWTGYNTIKSLEIK